MTSTIISLIEQLETHGYIVLGYHRGLFRIAGIRGWRDITWAQHVLRRAA